MSELLPLLLASFAITVARRALSAVVPDEPDYPFVCPGCYRVNAPCASWCPDLAMDIEQEDRESRGDDDELYDVAEDITDDIPW